MRIIFTIAFNLIYCGILLSQPVITSAYNPINGDTYIYKIVDDTSTAQPGQAGAGVIWNLASMHGLLTTRQYNWMYTGHTNDSATFIAHSNIAAEVIQNGQSPRYEFYQVGPTFTADMRKVGSHIDNAVDTFAGGGYMMFDYPLSFNQSCTDTMLGKNSVSDIYGRCTTTYDGYGTLQLEALSGGNFQNVARLKVVEDYIVSYGPVETHHVETYYWMDHATDSLRKQPIAIIKIHDWTDTFGFPFTEKFAYMRQIIFLNGVGGLTLSDVNVTVSPNPFTDIVTFSIPATNSEIDIQLSDITGRVIQKNHLQKTSAPQTESISLKDLRNGIYFAKVSSEEGSVVKKIIKN